MTAGVTWMTRGERRTESHTPSFVIATSSALGTLTVCTIAMFATPKSTSARRKSEFNDPRRLSARASACRSWSNTHQFSERRVRWCSGRERHGAIGRGRVQSGGEHPANLGRQHIIFAVTLTQREAQTMLAQPVTVTGGGVEVPDALIPGLRHHVWASSSVNAPLKLPIGAPPKLIAVNVRPDRASTLVSDTFMARFHLAVFRTIAYLICRLALSALISKITIAQHNSRLIMETAGIATQDAKFWAQLLHDMCRAEAASSAYALARARWHVLVSAPVEHTGGKKAALNSDRRRPRCGWRDLSPAPQLGVAEPRLERLCGACSLQ